MNRDPHRVALGKGKETDRTRQQRFDSFVDGANSLISSAATKTNELITKAATSAKVTTTEYCKQIVKLQICLSIFGFITTFALCIGFGFATLVAYPNPPAILYGIPCTMFFSACMYFVYKWVKAECAPYIVIVEYFKDNFR